MEKPLSNTAEAKINRWLTKNRYSLSWLAKEANIGQPYLSRMLNGVGKTKKPLLQTQLDKINRALQTNFKLTEDGATQSETETD